MRGPDAHFVLEATEGGVVQTQAEWTDGGFQSSVHLRRIPLAAGLAELLTDARPHPAFERAWARVRAETRWAADH